MQYCRMRVSRIYELVSSCFLPKRVSIPGSNLLPSQSEVKKLTCQEEISLQAHGGSKFVAL